MAHKKGVGSSRQRPRQQAEAPRRQRVWRRDRHRRERPGRQCGTKLHPGNTSDGQGLYPLRLISGVVKFET